MASTYLTRTTGTPTSTKTYTFSAWIKRCDIGAGNAKIFSRTWGSGGEEKLEWNADGIVFRQTSGGGGDTNWERVTNRKFRDSSGYYHVVVTYNSLESTATDRIKIYINGVQETSFSSSSDPSLDADSGFMDNGIVQNYGRYGLGGQFTSAIWSHVHLIDGTAYDATAFGQYDANGVWTIKTSPSVTYGNNGFFILKDGNSVTDQSGNGNNLTVGGGTLTKTEDNPSNVFCTINPLSINSGITLSKGNTQVDYGGSSQNGKGTLGFSSGKFYWEAKLSSVVSNYPMIGIGDMDSEHMQKTTGSNYPGGFTNSYGIFGNGSVYANGSNTGSQSFTYTTNDIIGIAVDLDSGTKTIKWFKNGSQIATTNITVTAPFTAMDYSGGGGNEELVYNFGNGYFGTTAVSSAGTNASGIGIFEYDVPTGYTALSTKGLNL
jgi:hypothetical protein